MEANKLYNITVIANNLDLTKMTQTFVLIKVRPDLHEKPLLFLPQEVEISELLPLGKAVGFVSATSEVQTVSYKIIDGNLLSTFEIDPHFGKIILARSLDYEKIQNFTLTILAETPFANVSSKIKIKVQNERDSIPLITTSVLNIQVCFAVFKLR